MKMVAHRILDVGEEGLNLTEFDFIRFSDGWRRFDVRFTREGRGIEIMSDIGRPIKIEMHASNHFYIDFPS